MGGASTGGQSTLPKTEHDIEAQTAGAENRALDEQKAFDVLTIGSHSPKPRTSGLTVVVDGMDGGFLSLRDVEALDDFAAEYIDYIKLGWTIARLTRASVVRQKIEALHRVGIRVLMGGVALEYASIQGRPEEFVQECVALGIDAVEVSTSTMIRSGAPGSRSLVLR